MIEDITEGQAKDMILEYCIEKRNSLINSRELGKELFPDTSIDIINLLLEKIDRSSGSIANVRLDSRTKFISSNGITSGFLKQGGYTKLEKDEQLRLEKETKKESLELELSILQKDNFEYQKNIRAQNDRIRNLEEQIKIISLLKLYWWLIPILISIGIFLKTLWDIVR